MNDPDYKALEARVADLEERLELVRQGALSILEASKAHSTLLNMLCQEVFGMDDPVHDLPDAVD